MSSAHIAPVASASSTDKATEGVAACNRPTSTSSKSRFILRAPSRPPDAPVLPARDQVRSENQSSSYETDSVSFLCRLDLQDGQGQSDDGQREGRDCADTGVVVETGESGIDSEEMIDLLPLGGDSGIFDVQLPGGEIMGVVVDMHAAKASLLLTPGSEKLGNFLHRKKTELEKGLQRRIHRNVQITVL